MTANLQISKRLDDGTIVVLGADDVDTFAALASKILDPEGSEAVLRLFDNLIPAAGGMQQATNVVQGAFPQAAPVQQQYASQAAQAAQAQGQAPIGSNGLPQRWIAPGVSKRTGKSYTGFWADDNPR